MRISRSTCPTLFLTSSPKLKQLDIKLYEAALDLGCDPRQAFFKVILPEISPAILSAFLICLTYSIDDFMISYFNCGTVETLPIAIYSMTRKKVSPKIYALSTIMFVVILSVILVSNAMESRSYRRDQKTLREGGRMMKRIAAILLTLAVALCCRIAGVCRRYHRGDRGCLGVG